MLFHSSLTFFICFLDLTFVSSIRKCQEELCPDDLVCCKPQNSTRTACCRQVVDPTFYSIGVVTRKLSGILILLLLFTLGYGFHRLLCARARTQTPPHQHGLQTITASQEMLVDSCTPDSAVDPLPQLPTYEECKQLPTYEETLRPWEWTPSSGCGRPEPGSSRNPFPRSAGKSPELQRRVWNRAAP
uniref:Uncharacterized protein n=1 Tax=Oryzias melastigma TaxID=30732 RepID=A0A3B3CE66_ORYME